MDMSHSLSHYYWITSQKYGQSPLQLVCYRPTLSTKCHMTHVTKYGHLPLCVLWCHPRLRCITTLSYSTYNRNIHNHHYICGGVIRWQLNPLLHTGMWQLHTMYVFRSYQVNVSTKCLLMHTTGVWPLPIMYRLMCDHMALLTEYLITYTTEVWLLPTMYALMFDQDVLLTERLITLQLLHSFCI
jgi:hypothetical protein